MILRKLLLPAIAAGALVFAANQSMTLSELVGFIQSSVKMHQSDKEVADYLKHIKLSQKLDDRTIEVLQGQGAGPRTIAALHDLRESAANLAAPPPPAPVATTKPAPVQAPPPDSIEQARVLSEAREYALTYTQELPNFLCLESVKRSVDRDLNEPEGNETWQGTDSYITRLSFFDQKEDYKIVMVGNRSVENTGFEKIGGAQSFGEFGSMLKDIFETSSDARFDWDHWGTLRGRPMYVFAYDVRKAQSRYTIRWERDEPIVTGYKGLVYIDKQNSKIMRVTLDTTDVPPSFPIRYAKTVLDYEWQDIGGTKFVLPLKAVVKARTNMYLSKNEEEFRLYKRFGADTTIKFEEMNPETPEDKLKEKK